MRREDGYMHKSDGDGGAGGREGEEDQSRGGWTVSMMT